MVDKYVSGGTRESELWYPECYTGAAPLDDEHLATTTLRLRGRRRGMLRPCTA